MGGIYEWWYFENKILENLMRGRENFQFWVYIQLFIIKGMKMKNLHEIIDCLIELSAKQEAKPLRNQLDVIIEDLVYLELGKKDARSFQDLSPEEIEEIMLFEELMKGLMRNKLAMA